MSDEITVPDPIDLGDGRTVIFDEPTSGFYRVRMPNGEVQAFPAKADATPENAVDDIVTNPPASQTVEEFAAAVESAVQAWLDAGARAVGYDGILSACTYAAPPENPFSAEGTAFLTWRSAVWAACYAALAAHDPDSPLPTIADFIASLPAYVPPTP